MDAQSLPPFLMLYNVAPKFSKDPKYKIFSPLSIGYALSLLHIGAADSTHQELTKFFDGQVNSDDLIIIFTLLSSMMSNFLLLQKGFQFEQKYLDCTSSVASIREMDFTDSKSTAIINDIIEQQTKGMLKNVLSEIDPATIFMLMNIIYFKMNWMHPFKKDRTQKKNFRINVNQVQQVDMMEQTDRFKYFHDETNKNKFLELSYEGDQFSMIVMLPDEFIHHPVFDMTCLSSTALFGAVFPPEVHVQLPKFTSEVNIDMTGDLRTHGLISMFNNPTDFIKIGKNITVSNVIHAAKIIVDEEGTEAAATTIVMLAKCCGMPPPPIEFNVNRPFAYAIVHKPSRMVLFMGTFSG